MSARAAAVALLSIGILLAPGTRAADGSGRGTRPPHPEPRVIVNVPSVSGPHRRSEVEHAARLAWGKIIRCYESIDRNAKGMIALELALSAGGKVVRATRTDSTLESRELAVCLTDVMKRVAMPKAAGGSTARAEIHVAPGDR